jgi:ABC-type xylose transport system permease subunit
MLLAFAVVLALVWFLSYSVFSVTGGLIHVLLVLAAVSILWHFIRKRRVLWGRDQG